METGLAKISLRHPVVLVPGAGQGNGIMRVGPLKLGPYFQGIPEYLKDQGVEVKVAELPLNTKVADRAVFLRDFLQKHYLNKKVNIIGHSMGALDARYLISVLGYENIISLTGIAAPNRGSPIADWAYDQMEGEKFWYQVLRLLQYDLKVRPFLWELRTTYMRDQFNPNVIDSPKVRYYSVIGWGEVWDGTLSPLLYFPNLLLRLLGVPESKEKNDGMVPESSQEWGEVIARLPLDHLGQLNHHTLRWPNKKASLAMYQKIIERLENDNF